MILEMLEKEAQLFWSSLVLLGLDLDRRAHPHYMAADQKIDEAQRNMFGSVSRGSERLENRVGGRFSVANEKPRLSCSPVLYSS